MFCKYLRLYIYWSVMLVRQKQLVAGYLSYRMTRDFNSKGNTSTNDSSLCCRLLFHSMFVYDTAVGSCLVMLRLVRTVKSGLRDSRLFYLEKYGWYTIACFDKLVQHLLVVTEQINPLTINASVNSIQHCKKECMSCLLVIPCTVCLLEMFLSV